MNLLFITLMNLFSFIVKILQAAFNDLVTETITKIKTGATK